MKNEAFLHLPDTEQSWWQLTVIQLAGWMSLPILATSIMILQWNSFLGAILTIIVGNTILWFIRLGIVAMSHEKRASTLDISRTYFGNVGAYVIAVLLLVATVAWFTTQTNIASNTLTDIISLKENPDINQFVQISVFLGLVSTVLCVEGIRLLRWLSTFTFPLLVICFLVILFMIPDKSMVSNHNPLSLKGLSLVLATNLGISSDFPTFFRHSKSWNESIKALLAIQLISMLLGIFSLYFGALILQGFEVNEQLITSLDGFSLVIIFFIFLSVISANVANVYSASVGWEVLAPTSLVGRREYLILGLLLTIIFILISGLGFIEGLLNFCDTSLVYLCIILVLGYMITRWNRGEPAPFLQKTYFSAWLLAVIVCALESAFVATFSSLLLGLIIMVCVVFISISIRKLRSKWSS